MTTRYFRLLLLAGFVAVTLVGCGRDGGQAAEATPTLPPAPEGVLKARESVLEFLREGANECVPPPQAGWSVEQITNAPVGYDVYRFHSGGCVMTITVPLAESEAIHYHVALGDGPTGFCWQAVVDARGQVVLTGNEAQTEPSIGNPAAAYCEQNGYTYQVVTRVGGDLCGMCVFDDGRACNGWAYFHGACTPDTATDIQP